METESPWPIDPTPGAMWYFCVCAVCHGHTMGCPTGDIAAFISPLLTNLTRGDALHRVSATDIATSCWDLCHCRREEIPCLTNP